MNPAKGLRAQSPEDAFLGTGWAFPPTFDSFDHNVQMVSGETDIRESLWILFSTMIGERIMLPEYGSSLWRRVFQAINTTLLTQIQEDLRQAILQWEPRIEVERIEVADQNPIEGRLEIRVDYLIRTTNTRSNLVYPFYLNEGTIPPASP